MKDVKIGFAFCGSFCTLKKGITQMKKLKDLGADIYPIMSPIAYSEDTRFGKASEIKSQIESIAERNIIHTVKDSEPIGPKGLLDLLIVAPCTGNTLSKISLGITDSSVCMAVKAQLRNNRPVLLGIATNDALSGSAQNIGRLLNTKGIYFVPFGQDDPIFKETSMICDFELVVKAAEEALKGKQLQPILI